MATVQFRDVTQRTIVNTLRPTNKIHFLPLKQGCICCEVLGGYCLKKQFAKLASPCGTIMSPAPRTSLAMNPDESRHCHLEYGRAVREEKTQ